MTWKTKLFVFLFFLLFTFCSTIGIQKVIIDGYVCDDTYKFKLKNVFVQIVGSNKEGKFFSYYTITNSEGYYNIELPVYLYFPSFFVFKREYGLYSLVSGMDQIPIKALNQDIQIDFNLVFTPKDKSKLI